MEGFFVTIDLLGFSNIIKNSNPDLLNERIEKWLDLVERSARHAGVTRFQLISDTVFAAGDSSPEGFMSLIAFSQYILQNGVRASLPVRGAICHGHFEWGKLTYGKAVIKSHQLESSQDWIGIMCDVKLPFIKQMWAYNKLVCYPAPLKSGLIKLYPVVAWDVPNFSEICKLLTANGLSIEGDILSWQFAQKLRNTVEFGLYLKLIKKKGNDPSHFYGVLPVQLIELSIEQ